MSKFKFSRGVYVIEKITKFKGCITARMDSITGCNRYLIEPEVDEKGSRVEGCWFDEHSIEIDTSRQRLVIHLGENQPPG